MLINFWHIGALPTPMSVPPPAAMSTSRRTIDQQDDLFTFSFSGELWEAVPIRTQLQQWEDDGLITVVGAWDGETGQPIGGVGSPWFLTPEGFDTSSQRELLAGQAPRIFI